jgi:hypothetical protein
MDREAYGSSGGERMVITGIFPLGGEVQVYIGPLGSTLDPKTHSGTPGRRASVSRNGTELVVYLPKLAPGVYNLTAVSGLTVVHWPSAVTVRAANFASGQFALRAVFSPIFRVGPRSLDQVP